MPPLCAPCAKPSVVIHCATAQDLSLSKGKATASSALLAAKQPLSVSHVSKAARDIATKATPLSGEKDQLIRQHQEELSAQKTSYQELKSQLVQLGLDHAKALEAAEADAAAKMNEALENASNATVVLQAELEELAKARKGAEEKSRALRRSTSGVQPPILATDACSP
ncbi:hypothetical protein QYE76_054332 [Lolium multiflorum]|uniref:Uncharacterized protein n=1 Tax=Lolium multiflorum TaxID=4521 RepID=A0AAD8WMT9_LOLMU|nr:hypothetical protein QYE76_054332 [Lolium multiflorum]